MTDPGLRPLGFGEILDGAFSLYRRHFSTLFITALLATVPVSLMAVLAAGEMQDPEALGAASLLLLLVTLVASAVGWAALTRQTAGAIAGEPPSLEDGYRHGFRAFLPLLGAGVLGFLLLMLVGFLPLFVLGLMIGLGGFALAGETGMAVATGLFMVLGFALMVALFALLFAVPAAVVIERQGPWGALKRSWQLATGARLRVVGVVLVSSLIAMLPMFGVYAVGGVAGLFTLSPDAPPGTLWMVIETVMGLVFGALTYPFWVAAVTLLYFDRRVRSEAYDLELATAGLSSTD